MATAGLGLVPGVAADVPITAGRIGTRIRTWAPLLASLPGDAVAVSTPLVASGRLPLIRLSRVPGVAVLVRAGARGPAVALPILAARLGPPTTVALPFGLRSPFDPPL